MDLCLDNGYGQVLRSLYRRQRKADPNALIASPIP